MTCRPVSRGGVGETEMTWKLKRTTQCTKCPWRKDVNPRDIPNGYDEDKHCALRSTISSGLESLRANRVMACHESHDDYCIGWLMNQIGSGNNIGMRVRMRNCTNYRDIKLAGEQHETFEDTLPS